MIVPAARLHAAASQSGVSWTETPGADPRTEPCAVSASDDFSHCTKPTMSHAQKKTQASSSVCCPGVGPVIMGPRETREDRATDGAATAVSTSVFVAGV